MAPVYLFGGHLIWNVCLEQRSTVYRLVYCACVALSVVPQRLLEPRYFIIPFLIARIQKSPYFGTNNTTNITSASSSSSRRYSSAAGSLTSPTNSSVANRGFQTQPQINTNTTRGNNTGTRGRRNASSNRNNSRNNNGTINHVLLCSLRNIQLKVNHFSNSFPLAHVGWEFLYYLIINLVTLAVFGTKTFWWENFTEPQRIMW